MNKTIIININGIVFHIEEEAYDVLRSYMIDVKKYFGNSPDSLEIVGDIENRIAEMFNERIIAGKKEVITLIDVQEVTEQMGRVSDFGSETGEEIPFEAPIEEETQSIPRKLMRDPDDRVIGGVASGLGHFFGMQARWVRLIFIVLFFTGGSGLLFYLILWAVVPVAKNRADRMAMRGEAPNLKNFQRTFQEEMEGVRANFSEAGGKAKNFFQSVAETIGRMIIFFAKAIGILIILGICVGLIALLVSVFATFGILGLNDEMGMFPINIVDPEIRSTVLIASFTAVVIPLVALIGLIIRMLFNRTLIGRYTGFTLLAVWIFAVGVCIMYGVETGVDFNEESTIVEERPLEIHPVYTLNLNDLNVIRLEDSTYTDDRMGKIRRTAVTRNSSLFESSRRVYVRVQKVDSLQAPTVVLEYSAHGATYDIAAERAGQIKYNMTQVGDQLTFDSHFQIERKELMRDQEVVVRLLVPIGTQVNIHHHMNRYMTGVPVYKCSTNYYEQNGYSPTVTSWIMTEAGLKCMVDPPAKEVEDETDTIENAA